MRPRGLETLLPDTPDEVRFGTARRPRRRTGTCLLALGLTAGVAAAAIGVLAGHRVPQHNKPRPAMASMHATGPMLGRGRPGWKLFGWGPDSLVTIVLATGKVTTTAVPGLLSGNPGVSLVVGPHEAVIRSYDFVQGYLVPDGSAARPLTGAMADDGPLVEGPIPTEAWQFASPANTDTLVLVTLSGRRVGPTIALPPQSAPPTITADGRGDILVTDTRGQQYDAGPGWYHKVPGQVIAVGPGRWLIVSCRHNRHCMNMVIDPVNGVQRTLPGQPLTSDAFSWPPSGVISPDKSTAAIVDNGRAPSLHLINLSSGADLQLALPLAQEPAYENASMAWSPDSEWLFIAQDGKLLGVNARTSQVTTLGNRLPAVTRLAVRSE